MATIACGHTIANRGVAPVPVGRRYAISVPAGFDCWVSMSPVAPGDVVIGDFRYTWMLAGKVVVFFIPTGSPAHFLSGLTTDPNGDVTPTTLTFLDSGAAPF